MDQEIIVGYTDNKNYVLHGKLADGTPVYKFAPSVVRTQPLFEKKNVDKVIAKYNTTTELKTYDTSEYVKIVEDDTAYKINPKYANVEPTYKPKTSIDQSQNYEPLQKLPTVNASKYVDVFNKKALEEDQRRQQIDQQRQKREQKILDGVSIKQKNISAYQQQMDCDNKLRSEHNIVINEFVQKASIALLSNYYPVAVPIVVREPVKPVYVIPDTVNSTAVSIIDAYRKTKEVESRNAQIATERADNTINSYYNSILASENSKKAEPVVDTVSNYLTPPVSLPRELTSTTEPVEYISENVKGDEKEKLKDQVKAELLKEHKAKVEAVEEYVNTDSPYYVAAKPGAELVGSEPSTYLSLLESEERKDGDKERARLDRLEQHAAVLENELNEKMVSAQSYIRQVAFLNDQETKKLRLIEEEVDKAQLSLADEYSKLLVEQVPDNDFYDPQHDYEAIAKEGEPSITIRDNTSDKSVEFKYSGKLSSFKLSGYKLKIFSVTRKSGNAEGYISHNFVTYDLRDMSKIKTETYSFTKWDSHLLSEGSRASTSLGADSGPNPEVYNYGQLVWAYYTSPVPVTFLRNSQHPMSVSEVDTTNTAELHLVPSAGNFNNLYLGRVFNSVGSFSVDWISVSASVGASNTRALPGVDFVPASGTLTWLDGDSSYKELTGIIILENYESESIARRFDIQIANIRANTYGISSIGSVRQISESIDAANAQYFGTQFNMDAVLSAAILPKHHGVFAFTTGVGSATDIGLRGWSSSQFGDATLSAYAPGGNLGGIITLGIERLSGTYGDVTIRCLLSASIPPFAGSNDFKIGSGVEGYNGSGAFNYPSEHGNAEVAWRSPTVNGSTYNEDSLSGQLQTLTWVHGESGVKYINLEHSLAQPYGFSETVDYPKIWYAVYLTFDTSTQMGISATGPGVNSTRVPTPCAAIINASHGRSDNPHNIDAVNTTRRGAMPKPFWVAIDTDNIDRYPRFFTFNITMNPGYGTPTVGNILIYNSLGVNSNNTYVSPTTSISFSARSHGSHSIPIPADLITPTSRYIVVYEKVVGSVLTKDWRFGTVELGESINTTLPNTAQRNISAHIIEFTSSLSAIVPPGQSPYYTAYISSEMSYNQGYNVETVIGAGTRYVVFESIAGTYWLAQGFGAAMVNGDPIFVNILTTYNAENLLPVYSDTIPYSGGSFTSIFN